MAFQDRFHRAHRDQDLPSRTPRLLHLDVDAFLASVEEVLHPELAGKPVVIGGLPHERNLVMSCSYAARALGVRPGMRLFEAARRCPRAIFRRGDSQAANRLREEVVRVLFEFSPSVEIASIDDFFVDLTGTTRLLGAACGAAERIQREVRARVGLPLTVGVGTNRMLARLAGKLAKPGGIGEVLPGCEERFLAGLAVRELPGVGHKIGAALERFAIRTVGELRLVSREVLFASFGRPGLVIHERAHGRDSARVEPNCALDEAGELVLRPPRSLSREATFEPEEGRPAVIDAMLSYLVERAMGRLRSFRSVARTVEVRLRYVDTRPQSGERERAEGLAHAARASFRAPTDSTDEVLTRARALFAGFPRRRALVKRVGITLSNLGAAAGWQGRLFDDEAPAESRSEDGAESRADRQRRLDDVLDRLRVRHGFGRVLRGTSLPLGASHVWTPEGYRLRTPSLNQ